MEQQEQGRAGIGAAVVEEPEAAWADVWDEEEEGEEEEDPSFRVVRVRNAEGKEVLVEQRLTGANFLDPEEGDFFVQGIGHDADRAKLTDMLRQAYEDEPTTIVLSDVKIMVGVGEAHQPAPDAMVIPGVVELDQRQSSFDVREYGVKPVFVGEIVSPRYRSEDRVDKVISYAQMGIPEYFLIDTNLRRRRKGVRRPRRREPSYEVIGYRLVGDRYEQIAPDARGWVYSEQTQCWFGVTEDQQGFFMVNGRTGERLQPNLERIKAEQAARAAAERQAAAYERQAQLERATREAEAQARLVAEQRAAAEAQARLTAEQRAEAERAVRETEAQARLAAEQRAESERAVRETETQARLAAEQRAQAEAQARETEARARLAAEQRAESEAQARLAEAAARQALEAQVAALQAALAQRGDTLPPASPPTESPDQS